MSRSCRGFGLPAKLRRWSPPHSQQAHLTTSEAGKNLSPVLIVSGARTPIGSYGGALKKLSATELGVSGRDHARQCALRWTWTGGKKFIPNVCVEIAAPRKKPDTPSYRTEPRAKIQTPGALVASSPRLSSLVAQPTRRVCLDAGLPASVVSTTVNKVCSSGLKAVTLGAQSIALGVAQVVVAGGMESMSRVPYYSTNTRFGKRMGNSELLDGMVYDGLWDAREDAHMGTIAERQAAAMGITREDMDAFTATSYSRAAHTVANGGFREIVEIDGVLAVDEEVQRVKQVEKLGDLRAAFSKDGPITAGNSSKLSDGAAALVLASEEAVKKHGLTPLVRILAFADVELPPGEFTNAPSHAIPRALERAGLKISDVDFFEINEAFASVVIANNRLLNLNPERVNILGGAIALGHPIGASGARILTTLISALYSSVTADIGVAAICNGGGGSTALVIAK